MGHPTRRDQKAAENLGQIATPKKYGDDHRNPWIWADTTANTAARNIEGWYQVTFVTQGAVNTVHMSKKTHDELFRLAFSEGRSRRNRRWVLNEEARRALDQRMHLPSESDRPEHEAAITTLDGNRVWVESNAMTAALAVLCDLSDAMWGDTRNKIPEQVAQVKKNAAAILADHDGNSTYGKR